MWEQQVALVRATLTANVTEAAATATTAADIEEWERKFHPMNLPPDVKSFLMSSDGLKLTWHVRHGDDLLPLGCMHINSLAEMAPVPPEALLNESGELCAELPPPLPTGLQASRGWAPDALRAASQARPKRRTDRSGAIEREFI